MFPLVKSPYERQDPKLKEKFGTYVFKCHSLPDFPIHYLKYLKVQKPVNDLAFHKLVIYLEQNLNEDREGFQILYRTDGSIDSINFWLQDIFIYSADFYQGANKVEKTDYSPLSQNYYDEQKI